MLKRGAGLILAAALFVLSTPRTGSAGIGEWIWEMSGPQMVGGGIECKFNLKGELEICYGVARRSQDVRRYRVSIEGALYGSTGKDSNGVEYEAGEAWMLAFDPMLELVHHDNGESAIYHGVGISYNRLFGKSFHPFNNAAIKLRPLAARFGRHSLEFNIRVYPNRFNAADFGRVSPTPEETGAETVWSLSYGIAIGGEK